MPFPFPMTILSACGIWKLASSCWFLPGEDFECVARDFTGSLIIAGGHSGQMHFINYIDGKKKGLSYLGLLDRIEKLLSTDLIIVIVAIET